MILATTDALPGKRVVRNLGLVRGNAIRTRRIGRHLLAALRLLFGGEIPEYTKLIAEAREQALDRMKAEASRMGANAVVGVRFATSVIMDGAAELLAYGTAVVVEEDA